MAKIDNAVLPRGTSVSGKVKHVQGEDECVNGEPENQPELAEASVQDECDVDNQLLDDYDDNADVEALMELAEAKGVSPLLITAQAGSQK